jgi:hypothetical protein
MALRLNRFLTEMSAKIYFWAKALPARIANNITANCEPTVYKMWDCRRLTTLYASMA